MTAYILVIWTIVAGTGGAAQHGWRVIGEFTSLTRCELAARQLKTVGDGDSAYRCLEK